MATDGQLTITYSHFQTLRWSLTWLQAVSTRCIPIEIKSSQVMRHATCYNAGVEAVSFVKSASVSWCTVLMALCIC